MRYLVRIPLHKISQDIHTPTRTESIGMLRVSPRLSEPFGIIRVSLRLRDCERC